MLGKAWAQAQAFQSTHGYAASSGARWNVADLATAGHEVVLRLEMRRFLCGNDGCQRRIFAEQVDGLTVRYGRRSMQPREVLRRIA